MRTRGPVDGIDQGWRWRRQCDAWWRHGSCVSEGIGPQILDVSSRPSRLRVPDHLQLRLVLLVHGSRLDPAEPFPFTATIFLPGIALFLGFLVGYLLIAPWGCSQSFTSNPTTGWETVSPVVCISPVGSEYSGPEPFEPSRTRALIAGSLTGVVATAVTWAGPGHGTIAGTNEWTHRPEAWNRGFCRQIAHIRDRPESAGPARP